MIFAKKTIIGIEDEKIPAKIIAKKSKLFYVGISLNDDSSVYSIQLVKYINLHQDFEEVLSV